MAPDPPGLSDDPAKMADVVRAARDAGATAVWTNVLYLRPGTREHFLENLARDWPELLPAYERLYDGRAYVAKDVLEPVRQPGPRAGRAARDRRPAPGAVAPRREPRAVAPATLRAALAGAVPCASPRRPSGQRAAPRRGAGSASQSARTGEKMSTTMAPSGPATASCGRFDVIRHVPPGPSSRRSPSIVNVIEPSMQRPSCSCSWRCSGTIAFGRELHDREARVVPDDHPRLDGVAPDVERRARRRCRAGSSLPFESPCVDSLAPLRLRP